MLLVVLQVDETSSVAVNADTYDNDETGPFAAVKQSVLAGIAVWVGASYTESVQVDELVDVDSHGVAVPAEPVKKCVPIKVSIPEDVLPEACDRVEVPTGIGVKAELSRLVDTPFALPVVKRVVSVPESDDVTVANEIVSVLVKSVAPEVTLVHVETDEFVTAAPDT
ncbi:hypothetical protein RAB80_010925 [Fusarium oxysporum f. sp. vasinfectum]|nr:hypothetical protein RAB80_010925 [Fusarium oxysporum f. sp. vasinfectum]KAK2929797.1 hypothetical protein FoTM2_010137 [Fusarium oxysporum f. sp. vasinfectum]